MQRMFPQAGQMPCRNPRRHHEPAEIMQYAECAARYEKEENPRREKYEDPSFDCRARKKRRPPSECHLECPDSRCAVAFQILETAEMAHHGVDQRTESPHQQKPFSVCAVRDAARNGRKTEEKAHRNRESVDGAPQKRHSLSRIVQEIENDADPERNERDGLDPVCGKNEKGADSVGPGDLAPPNRAAFVRIRHFSGKTKIIVALYLLLC